MADIELVIKINKEKYDVIKSDLYNTFPAEMKEWGLEAIRNGTPLPKGHGRLIDMKNLQNFVSQYTEHDAVQLILADREDYIPTIIEADTESEDKKMKHSELYKIASPKPCPFCGWGTIVDGSYLTGHSCACMSCGARTRKVKTWEEAVELWNVREYENRVISVDLIGKERDR